MSNDIFQFGPTYWSIRAKRSAKRERTAEEKKAEREKTRKLNRHPMCRLKFKTEKEAKRYRTSQGFTSRQYIVLEGFDLYIKGLG